MPISTIVLADEAAVIPQRAERLHFVVIELQPDASRAAIIRNEHARSER